MWEHFLPRLPLGAVAVVAGRTAPDLRWVADPGWADLLRVVPLRNLAQDDATTFLRARGVPAEAHHALLSFTGGNPLALSLSLSLAVAVAGRQDAEGTPRAADWAPGLDVIATLLPQLVGDPPSQDHRTALEVCAQTDVRAAARGPVRRRSRCGPPVCLRVPTSRAADGRTPPPRSRRRRNWHARRWGRRRHRPW
nr:hypothetical protein [Streptomyces sp. V4I2]